MERERHIMVMIDEQERIRPSSLLKIVPSSTESGERERERESDSARVAQLEKTVKWWSECTASWREKWGRVIIQRDELRNENHVLKGRNEALITEFQRLKNESDFLRCDIKRLRSEKRTAVVGPLAATGTQVNNNKKVDHIGKMPNRDTDKFGYTKNKYNENYVDQLLRNDTTSVTKFSFPGFLQDIKIIEGLLTDDDSKERSSLIPASRYKTDHVTNAIITEKLSALKEYVTSCEKFVVSYESEYAGLKSQLHELETWKTQILMEYEEAKGTMAAKAFIEDKKDGGTTEKSTRNLYAEIQRLQQENSNEWTKREQSETKLFEMRRLLRREQQNKKELEEELKKKSEGTFTSHATERRQLTDELDAKTREVTELKSACNKLRRQAQEKANDLVHEKKRADFLDEEVKNLRTRIEELKEKVLTSEESVDQQGNAIRRLQRTLDEQVGQTEALQAELKHVNIRLQRQSKIMTCRSEESIDM